MEDRIIELETRYAYLEHLVEELSGAMYTQQKELDSLRIEVSRLRSLLAEEPWAQGTLPHEKPPHY